MNEKPKMNQGNERKMKETKEKNEKSQEKWGNKTKKMMEWKKN